MLELFMDGLRPLGFRPNDPGSQRIAIMSFGFLGIFMAFNTTQMVLSTALNDFYGTVSHMEYDLGSASLMIMYISTIPSLWIVPRIVRRRGPVPVMILGGLCYVIYITSLIWPWEPTVILASCLIGFGQASIWVSQGVYLSSSSNEEQRGTDAGLFWGIYSASGIIGPFLGFFVYEGSQDTGFFLFSTSCALIGTVVFIGLLPDRTIARSLRRRPASLDEYYAAEEEAGTEREPLMQITTSPANKITNVDEELEEDQCYLCPLNTSFVRLVLDRFFPDDWTIEKARVLIKLIPFMFYVGISDAFVNASFPLMFAQKNNQEPAVFLVFLGWGFMETFGALAFSRYSDTMGRTYLLCFSAVLYLIGYAASVLILFADGLSDTLPSEIGYVLNFDIYRVSWLAFVAGAAFGLADTLSNTQAFAILGDHFPESKFSIDAYAVYQLLQALGMAIGFALSLLTTISWLNSSILIGLQLLSLTLSMIGVLSVPSATTTHTTVEPLVKS